jgi:hypothetical protein
MSTSAATTATDGANGKLTLADKTQIADLVIKAVGSLLLLISGWFGVIKYFDDQEIARATAKKEREDRAARQVQEDKMREKEFQVRLFEQKMTHYVSICDAAARIAISEKLEDVRDDLRTFYTLYWGKVCMFESKDVELAQLAINGELAKATDPKAVTSKELRKLCYNLAHACRKDLDAAFLQPKKEESEHNRGSAAPVHPSLFNWDTSKYLQPTKVTK